MSVVIEQESAVYLKVLRKLHYVRTHARGLAQGSKLWPRMMSASSVVNGIILPKENKHGAGEAMIESWVGVDDRTVCQWYTYLMEVLVIEYGLRIYTAMWKHYEQANKN